jgi:hypothetical protein
MLKRFGKRPRADCYECERLNREEADAAIELARLDDNAAARDRLLDARERLRAHRAVQHPMQLRTSAPSGHGSV